MYLISFNCCVSFDYYCPYGMKWASFPFCLMFTFIYFFYLHPWFMQHIDFIGFICTFGIISICVLKNTSIGTVCYLLHLLVSWGFSFMIFFPLLIPLQNQWFALHVCRKVSLPSVLIVPDCNWLDDANTTLFSVCVHSSR